MRNHRPTLTTLLCALALAACDDTAPGGSGPRDADPDRAVVDAAGLDAALPDGAPPDGALPDVVEPDALPDLAPPDALPDLAPPDALPDLAPPDALPDLDPPDLAPPDLGPPAICGDGRVEGDEGCDDGALEPGDGCDADCRVEEGFACDHPDLASITVEIDGLLDCEADPARPDPPPWPAWRATYVGGAVLYSARENPWSHRFDVRIERGGRGQMPLDFQVGEGRYASAEEAEDAARGRATPPFAVGPRDAVALWFPDAECAGNEGTLTVRLDAVSACRPIGPERCDDGLDDDLNGLADCADPACADACAERYCGDAILDAHEGCDDGARDDGDGCDTLCRPEPGYACAPAEPETVPAEIDAFEHCVPGSPEGLPVALAADAAWRARYVSGAARFSILEHPWAARFVVRIERGGEVIDDLPVGADRFPSAEAASAAVEGQQTPVFRVEPGDAVSAYFPDADCNRNDGIIRIAFDRVSDCVRADR